MAALVRGCHEGVWEHWWWGAMVCHGGSNGVQDAMNVVIFFLFL